MHGRSFGGGGRHHWGGGRPGRGWGGGWGGGFGGGFGWVFPAMILGRLVSEALERRGEGPLPPAPPATSGAGPAWSEPAAAEVRCANCGRGVTAGYAFCPHCGQSVSQRECRYCGRELKRDQRTCVGCGAPPSPSQT